MAYIVPRKGDVWDIRESRSTRDGPRSSTLASFKTLTPDVLLRAEAKAAKPLDPAELRHKARRAGAPVEPSAADGAVAELLAEIDAGHPPRPVLKRLLLDALGASTTNGPGLAVEPKGGELGGRAVAASANARAAAAWIGATPKQRGDALRELLLLTDQLPDRVRRTEERFPRIHSKPSRLRPA